MPELKSAQKRAFDYLVRQFGMRVEPFPDELKADLNDAFSIWSAMVSSADQPTFAYVSLPYRAGNSHRCRLTTPAAFRLPQTSRLLAN